MNRYRGMKACFIVLLLLLGSFATSVSGQNISEEAHKYMNWGLAALEMAKTDADFEDALKEFNKAAELAPDWADAYYNLGLVQEKLGKDDDALKNWRKYLELSPNAAESEVLEIKHRINNLEYKAKKEKELLEYKAKKEKELLESLRVLIPAGEFLMGERPQHKVFLDAYYIDKYEITVAQYRKFCETTGRSMPSAPSWGWQDNYPMVNVAWEDDATAYAQYYGKRLPTEAEWEKAARAGSTTKYCFGDDPSLLGDYAWYSANSSNQTHPVGTKKPNAFGIYDMHGNAWEWCADWYANNYYRNSPTNNPKGPSGQGGRWLGPGGQGRVLRGGSWGAAVVCRSAGRGGFSLAGRLDGIGFRCASSP